MGIDFIQAIGINGMTTRHEAPARFEYSARVRLASEGFAGLHVGMDENGLGGYALMADVATQSVHMMERKEGAVLLDRGMKRLRLESGPWYPIRVVYDGQILRLWFDENSHDPSPWPKFEFALPIEGRFVGFEAGRRGAEVRDEVVREHLAEPSSGVTFTNPVTVGADPDILLHEGVYYLYNRVPNDPSSTEDAYLYEGGEHAALDEAGETAAIFRVLSSTDLVNWSSPNPVLYRTEVLEGAFCMSPNVFHKDGLFYLLFAAGRIAGDEDFHIYYAVSTAPTGPFEMRSMRPLHSEVAEIGGMPFVDDDGQVYITYVRFDRGNHIYLQRLQVADGVISPEDDTLHHVLSPEADYEVDQYGRIAEGGVIIPHDGRYYMIYATGHYLGHYGEAYAVADDIFGPYERYAHNPILHHNFVADGTGDGIVVYSPDRTQMYMAYHRHISATEVEPRVTCLDPMKFVPNPDGGPDILTVKGPSTVPQPMPFV